MARIALVCEPPDGGAAEHVTQLALGLPAHGHEVEVFGPAGFLPAERLGRALRPLPFRRDYAHPLDDARSLVELVRVIRAGKFDLVHAHASKAGVLARAAAIATGRPAVYTPHCFAFEGEVSAARRYFSLGLERAFGRLSSAIVCVCDAEHDLARSERIAPRDRLVVVHGGCPSCDGAVPEDELLERRRHGPVIGSICVLRRQKRIDVLLDAAPKLLDAVPGLTIAVVGDGPELPRLRAQAAALGPGVMFVPFRPPSERALHALDLYVLPSGWESLPIGLLEAQACGVPQVATDVGGNREAVVPETGVLVPPRDPDALADAIISLLRDPDRRRTMAAASRARHAARFRVERMVAATAELYARVLAERGRPRS